MGKSIDEKILNRFKKATGSFDQAVELMEVVVMPTLVKDLEGDATAIRIFEEGIKYLKAKQEANKVLVGKLQESVPIFKEVMYEGAAIEMLQKTRDYFLAGDPDTIREIMSLFREKSAQDALMRMTDEEFKAQEDVLTAAKARRLGLE